MLVLSRKMGEQIVIDHEIEVTVIRIRGGKVQLGISAPDNVTILREEVLHRFEEPAAHECSTF
jgi:carbon storage regulator